jgi:cytochrome c
MGVVLKLPDLFLLAVGLSALVLSFWSNGAMAAGDPVKGLAIFAQCQACHSADKGVNKIGPSLYGIVGRPAGSIAGYDYSPAMQAAAKKGLIWTPKNMGAYLQNPHKYLDDFDKDPGLVNKMPFFLTDEQQREDVVAYLKSLPGGH